MGSACLGGASCLVREPACPLCRSTRPPAVHACVCVSLSPRPQVVDGHITAKQAVIEIMNLPQIEER